MSYERLLSYGHFIQLQPNVNVEKLIAEIEPFPFARYNPKKDDIPRYGLSVTSEDGSINGIDLDSLHNHEGYDELSFRTLTEVYTQSEEVRKLVDPFKDYLGRCHFLKFGKGGYFPPHRDNRGARVQEDFRIIVPLKHCNPPNSYLIFDDRIKVLNEGFAYFMNTNLEHSFFSYSKEALMLVMNIEACDGAYESVFNNMFST